MSPGSAEAQAEMSRQVFQLAAERYLPPWQVPVAAYSAAVNCCLQHLANSVLAGHKLCNFDEGKLVNWQGPATPELACLPYWARSCM